MKTNTLMCTRSMPTREAARAAIRRIAEICPAARIPQPIKDPANPGRWMFPDRITHTGGTLTLNR